MQEYPTEQELLYLTRQFANMFGLPVRLYHRKQQIYYFSTVDLGADPMKLCAEQILSLETSVGYFVHLNVFYYGVVNCRDYCFAIGPASEVGVSDGVIQQLASLLGMDKKTIPFFQSGVNALSGLHLDTVIQIAILFNYAVNREMRDITDIRIQAGEQKRIAGEILSEEAPPLSGESAYRSKIKPYYIEADIVRKVRCGDVEGLADGATKVLPVTAKPLAPDLIRHRKNMFIHLETMVSRAALEAGVDADEIFAAESQYMTKIESLENPDRIKNLQYHMILDYAKRVRRLREDNASHSRFVSEVAGYIHNHITEPISTSDIARHFQKSRGRITTRFKQESGINLSDFIKQKKIQEACELLRHTDRSLCEISNRLGFSSQSYFTKVFREITGLTPSAYRNAEERPFP